MSQTNPNADEAAAAAALRDDLSGLGPKEQQEVKNALGAVGDKWWVLLVVGLITLIVGLLIVFNVNAAILTIAIFFGIYLVVTGIFEVVRGFSDRLDTGGRVLSVIVGALSIVLGVLCLRNIATGVEILVLFIGLALIMRGLMELFVGFSNRDVAGSGWLITTGVLSSAVGVAVLVWPQPLISTMAWLIGLWLIVLALIEIVVAFQVKKAGGTIDRVVAQA